LIWFSINIL